MKDLFSHISLGKATALTTFVMASTIFAMYFFTGDLGYGFIGYFFFLFAVPANIIILIVVLKQLKKKNTVSRKNRGIGLMLLNIPVAILYFAIGLYLVDVMRITIENNTGKDLTHLQIIGCDNKELGELKNGSSKTVWIHVDHDCSIQMKYKDATGTPRLEMMVSYATPGMGQKYTYSMGKGEVGW